MPAYVRLPLPGLLSADPIALVGQLHQAYAADNYATQFTQQTKAWANALPLLKNQLTTLIDLLPRAAGWSVLLEFPLYRLRRRIDLVLLTEHVIVPIEIKVGESVFRAEDARQAEEYALDLRDFHAESHKRALVPVLWCTASPDTDPACYTPGEDPVAPVHRVGAAGLAELLASVPASAPGDPIAPEVWDNAPYRPVPNVIEAATAIFAHHNVEAILRKDACNLERACSRVVQLIVTARQQRRRALIFLTGVPGSGKTLAGLQVVHDAVTSGHEQEGDIIYLSGNTPLVTVLREALAQDQHHGRRRRGEVSVLVEHRRKVRARVQHINDFLKDRLASASAVPPHEHAIVFDEGQRAWDAEQGKKKFGRDASEPTLLLELMARHPDWCACVCLVGGGQEINTGEQGVRGWGDALRHLGTINPPWSVYAPNDVLHGGPSTAGLSLGPVPALGTFEEPDLQLLVPLRSFRSERVSEWVDRVLEGDAPAAAALAGELARYPIMLTRSLSATRQWLRDKGRGERRFGLVASSGARRLRADGVGQILHASDGHEIAHWYLRPPGDIRSSCALEVPANEYTCQGLELDFVGVCWGGDLLRSSSSYRWIHRRLRGPKWQTIQDESAQRLLRNSYRVLLTRAREGLVLWVPHGDPDDDTRAPIPLDATADFLLRCGAQALLAGQRISVAGDSSRSQALLQSVREFGCQNGGFSGVSQG
jgi:hypothetical protein